MDAGDQSIAVTIQCRDGSITLASTSGLQFSRGNGVLDKFMEFTGPLADVNRALFDLVYQPDENYNTQLSDTDIITFVVDDKGNTGFGSSYSVRANAFVQFVTGTITLIVPYRLF